MYLGEMVGSGTQVFDNIVSRKITSKAVSYTHLDVYKRQGYHGPAAVSTLFLGA